MAETAFGIPLPDEMVGAYIDRLTDKVFKILPMREAGDPTLKAYTRSLQEELLGSQWLMDAFRMDPRYMSLLSTVQYLSDRECDVPETKRKVFDAIHIVGELKKSMGGAA